MSLKPLADRLRTEDLDQYIGQNHIIGKGSVLRKSIESGILPSFIMWGPPGVGKTTLAKIISSTLEIPFYTLSAVSSGVKDVRETLESAAKKSIFNTGRPVLFIDEIHRFNKSQQDSLLAAVEEGTVTLIGATTENPSFEVIPALLSRCQVYVLQPFSKEELNKILNRAIKEDSELKKYKIEVKENNALFRYSGGDGRKLLNILELIVNSYPSETPNIIITDAIVTEILQQKTSQYDKSGEMHYDIISAFIKSIRGSDPNAAVYWLARMIDGGEDPKFIARRLIISASEDIGLANPNALIIANATFDAVEKIGWPEGRIILSEAAVYLATSPKSNSTYMAISEALAEVKDSGSLNVPLSLRNAPTKLMKELGYGNDYKYSHNYDNNFAEQEFLPEQIAGKKFYTPGKNVIEEKIAARLKELWKDKYST
jgi:putative ATPase